MPRTFARDFETCRRELEDYAEEHCLFPQPEQDLRRSDVRFAAEVAVAALTGEAVPNFARLRAFETLLVLAKG